MRREPWTLRRCACYVPAREDECWRREAVRAEDCAAQPCLTSGVSGERSEVRCTPGLGGAVEAGLDVERGKALEGTRKEGPVGAVVVWKGCASECDEAPKLGTTKAWCVWVGARAECGRGRPGAKNGARPEREVLPLSL